MRQSDHFAPDGALRSLAYRLVWSCADTLYRAEQVCLYVAAGLLRRNDFRDASRALWRQFATSADEVDGGLEIWERRVYDDVLHRSDGVLLVGCGAGRDLVALRELGYDVTGLDATPELVDQAREHLARRRVTARVQQGFVETADINGTYEVVVFAGCCYSYILRSASRVATLARTKTHLSPEGRVLIFYTGLEGRAARGIWLTRIVGDLVRADWQPERGDSFSRGYAAHRLLRYEHAFAPGEVARECAEAGLRVVRDEINTPFPYVIAVPG